MCRFVNRVSPAIIDRPGGYLTSECTDKSQWQSTFPPPDPPARRLSGHGYPGQVVVSDHLQSRSLRYQLVVPRTGGGFTPSPKPEPSLPVGRSPNRRWIHTVAKTRAIVTSWSFPNRWRIHTVTNRSRHSPDRPPELGGGFTPWPNRSRHSLTDLQNSGGGFTPWPKPEPSFLTDLQNSEVGSRPGQNRSRHSLTDLQNSEVGSRPGQNRSRHSLTDPQNSEVGFTPWPKPEPSSFLLLEVS